MPKRQKYLRKRLSSGSGLEKSLDVRPKGPEQPEKVIIVMLAGRTAAFVHAQGHASYITVRDRQEGS